MTIFNLIRINLRKQHFYSFIQIYHENQLLLKTADNIIIINLRARICYPKLIKLS